MLFERVEQEAGVGSSEEGASAAVRRAVFEDEDYEEHNKRHNRVKNYSFSIGRPR